MEIRFYLKTLVESMGHRPVLSKNGVDGLLKLKEISPDLVILDVMMPKKGGSLVYRELMTDKKFRDLPLIIFSGVNRDAFLHYLKMLNLSPDRTIPEPKYYIEKTVDPEYLKQVINRMLV